MSSSDLLHRLRPSSELVIPGLMCEAAVEDADELVGKLAPGDLGRVRPGVAGHRIVRSRNPGVTRGTETQQLRRAGINCVQ